MTWGRAIDRNTTWTEVLAVIEQQTKSALDQLETQLKLDPEIDVPTRAALLARAEQMIRNITRDTLETVWLRFRLTQ